MASPTYLPLGKSFDAAVGLVERAGVVLAIEQLRRDLVADAVGLRIARMLAEIIVERLVGLVGLAAENVGIERLEIDFLLLVGRQRGVRDEPVQNGARLVGLPCMLT